MKSFDDLKRFAVADILSASGKEKTSRVIEKHMNDLIEVALIVGRLSKQKEVDELKNRIDKVICCLKVVNHAHLYEYMDYVINLLDEDEQDE